MLTECMDGLFHKITVWRFKYGVIKTTENCFNLPNNAQMCFDKLTVEQNNKKIIENFSFSGSLSL